MALPANPYAVPDAVLDRATPDPRVLADAIDARQSVYRVLFAENKGDGHAEVYTGTGFAIRARGNKCLILTCDHVIRGEGGRDFDADRDALFVRKMCTGGDLRVWDFRARVCYTHKVSDLAVIEATGMTEVQPLRLDLSPVVLGRTAVAVGYCDVESFGMTRMPTVSTGAITSYPYLMDDGQRNRVQIDLSCVGVQGNSGCPVVSSYGVLGVLATSVVDVDTGRFHASRAVHSSCVLDVMKQWIGLPANDASTIDRVIEML